MPGFSTVTGDESIVWADNISCDGTDRGGKITTDGEILIGSTVSPHIRKGSLISADGTVTITNGAGSINLAAGGAVPTAFVAEDATVCSPVANILNIVGTAVNGINTSAAGNTLSIGMSSPYVGNFAFENSTAATPLVLTVENNDTDPGSYSALALSTEPGGGDAYILFEVDSATQYYAFGVDNSVAGDPIKLSNNVNPSSGDALVSVTNTGVVTLFNDLDVSDGGTGVSTLTSHGILMGNGAGDINATAEPTNGQILIGSTGNFPTLGTLTAGAGVSITNAAGSITLAVATGGLTWTDATSATYNLAIANGYITNRGGGVTYTLPATAALGDTIKFIGKDGLATIAQNANQQIFIGNTNTTLGAGGTLSATDEGDCLTLVCITAGASTSWRTSDGWGNWAPI